MKETPLVRSDVEQVRHNLVKIVSRMDEIERMKNSETPIFESEIEELKTEMLGLYLEARSAMKRIGQEIAKL